MRSRQPIPPLRIHRAKPRMLIPRRRLQVLYRRSRRQQLITRRLISPLHPLIHIHARLHRRRARLSRWRRPISQPLYYPGHRHMDDPQMIQRHPHRPIPAAILHPRRTLYQHPPPSHLRAQSLYQSTHPPTFPLKLRRKRFPRPHPPPHRRQHPPDHQFHHGQPRPRRRKLRFNNRFLNGAHERHPATILAKHNRKYF